MKGERMNKLASLPQMLHVHVRVHIKVACNTCCTQHSLIWTLWKELRPSLHFNINKVYLHVYAICIQLVCT